MEEYLIEAAKKLSFMAQTSGGVAGKDTVLINAIDEFEKALVKYQQEKHSFAARFAEWIEENHWWRSTDTRFPETLGRWTNHINGDVPLSETKTTEQLLELFNK